MMVCKCCWDQNHKAEMSGDQTASSEQTMVCCVVMAGAAENQDCVKMIV